MTGAGYEVCVRVRVVGRVQGVWFRAWTVQEATRRGLAGWVRNCHDGAVEAVFAGSRTDVEDMILACRRGPPAASVTALIQEPEMDAPEPGRFGQVATT
ncbi:MAG: acylphosphatase [Alphaproteobacteria bacterium]|nr:acylphosphatase [Alphaproteobacteria bacterium]